MRSTDHGNHSSRATGIQIAAAQRDDRAAAGLAVTADSQAALSIESPQLGEYLLWCLSGTPAINRVPLYTALYAGAGRRRIPLEHASPHRPDA
jgi:hypothetical protein